MFRNNSWFITEVTRLGLLIIKRFICEICEKVMKGKRGERERDRSSYDMYIGRESCAFAFSQWLQLFFKAELGGFYAGGRWKAISHGVLQSRVHRTFPFCKDGRILPLPLAFSPALFANATAASNIEIDGRMITKREHLDFLSWTPISFSMPGCFYEDIKEILKR